jgi:hypothetical protein
LDLEKNNFTGNAFFSGIYSLADTLTNYRLSGNNFDGSIPTRINEFTLLESLWLADNNLVGSIPDGITDLNKLGELNNMSLLIAFNNI